MKESNCFGQTECKQSIANEIATLAGAMADQAERVAIRADEKLSQICSPSVPLCTIEKNGVSREYPPLFSDLRDKLLCIERALNKINNVLGRAEI